MPLGVVSNIKRWAGGFVSPASQYSTPNPSMPDVRATNKKYIDVIYEGPFAANQVFTSKWYDTQQTGDTWIQILANSLQAWGTVAGELQVQGSNDQLGTIVITLPFFVSTTVWAANVWNVAYAYITTRYWRITSTNGATASSLVSFTYTALNNPPNMQAYLPGTAGAVWLPISAQSQTGTAGLDSNFVGNLIGSNNSPIFLQTIGAFQAGAVVSANINIARTPNIYKGWTNGSAGLSNITVWIPRQGTRFRLLRYKIEVPEDVTIAGGPLPINLALDILKDQTTQGLTNSYLGPWTWSYSHRFVAPASALATSGSLFDTGWIDLMNGILALNNNDQLLLGICTPQSTSAITPTWTIPSNQWEATTVGFKTFGNQGNFRMVQSTNGSSTTSTTTNATSMPITKGNTVIVVIRTTNVVGGAPTIAVSDTQGNTYTVLTKNTNASDGANGSSLTIAYSTNVAGNSNNTITVTTSVNIPTATLVHFFEYAGMGTGSIDAAQVVGTGNSTSPSSGAYTPATAGDLIITVFATAANTGAAATVSNNLRPVQQNWTASGSMALADNFGNTSFATGNYNFIGIGTEE